MYLHLIVLYLEWFYFVKKWHCIKLCLSSLWPLRGIRGDLGLPCPVFAGEGVSHFLGPKIQALTWLDLHSFLYSSEYDCDKLLELWRFYKNGFTVCFADWIYIWYMIEYQFCRLEPWYQESFFNQQQPYAALHSNCFLIVIDRFMRFLRVSFPHLTVVLLSDFLKNIYF